MTRAQWAPLVCFIVCWFLFLASFRCFAADPLVLEATVSIESTSSESQPSDGSGAEVEPTPPPEEDTEPPLEESPEPELPPEGGESEPDISPPSEELPEELPLPDEEDPPPNDPALPPGDDSTPTEGDDAGRSVTSVDLDLYAEGLSEYEMLYHIRYCVIFFVFGLVPFTYGAWIVFLLSRWIYLLCLRSV